MASTWQEPELGEAQAATTGRSLGALPGDPLDPLDLFATESRRRPPKRSASKSGGNSSSPGFGDAGSAGSASPTSSESGRKENSGKSSPEQSLSSHLRTNLTESITEPSALRQPQAPVDVSNVTVDTIGAWRASQGVEPNPIVPVPDIRDDGELIEPETKRLKLTLRPGDPPAGSNGTDSGTPAGPSSHIEISKQSDALAGAADDGKLESENVNLEHGTVGLGGRRRSRRAGRAHFDSPPPSPPPEGSASRKDSEQTSEPKTNTGPESGKQTNIQGTSTQVKTENKADDTMNPTISENGAEKSTLRLRIRGDRRQNGREKVQDSGNAHDDSSDDGNDWCSACGGTGRILLCDNCPRSFHFTCAEPPVDESKLPEQWLCRVCQHAKGIDPPLMRQPMFRALGLVLDKRSPVMFQLPKSLRERFDNVATGKDGEYVEEPPHRIEPTPGVQLCHRCLEAESDARPLGACERCGQCWHADCLPEPQWSRHLPRRWTCPLHADNAAPLPRKPRRPLVSDVALRRAVPNDGQIEVDLDNDDDEAENDGGEAEQQVKKISYLPVQDTDTNHVGAVRRVERGRERRVWRLPARAIKLDFIDTVHNLRTDPWRPTAARDLVVELDELARRPDPEREAVRDLMDLQLQGPSIDAACARRNLEVLVDAAFDDEHERIQISAIRRLMQLKGRERLLEVLSTL